MKLSQAGLNLLLETPPKDKMSFILDEISDAGGSCEYALLLGAPLDKAERRALYAAKLYHDGRIRYIISSGGVRRDNVGDRDIDILAGKNAGMAGILMDTEGYYPQLSVEYRITELKEIKNCL